MQHTNTSSKFYERRLDHDRSVSYRDPGSGQKSYREEPLFSCMGLSFEERFGNVARDERFAST